MSERPIPFSAVAAVGRATWARTRVSLEFGVLGLRVSCLQVRGLGWAELGPRNNGTIGNRRTRIWMLEYPAVVNYPAKFQGLPGPQKYVKKIAFMAVILGLGLLFYILLGLGTGILRIVLQGLRLLGPKGRGLKPSGV